MIYYTTPREEARPFYRAVYRDENILIADKYAGVNAEGLFCALHAESGARFIHRLDRNTSGLMAFALNAAAERELLAAFRERRAEKIYQHERADGIRLERRGGARIAFRLPRAAGGKNLRGSVLSPVYKAERNADGVPQKGRKSRTRPRIFAPLRGCGAHPNGVHGRGKLRRILPRGDSPAQRQNAPDPRPVVGDEKYGDEALNKKYHVSRQVLVAKRLSFRFSEGALAYLDGKVFESAFCARLPEGK